MVARSSRPTNDQSVIRAVSSMTVYRLIKGGDLPAVRVGRSFRVSEADVDAYLARARELGAKTLAVTPHNRTLEDLFLAAARAPDTRGAA